MEKTTPKRTNTNDKKQNQHKKTDPTPNNPAKTNKKREHANNNTGGKDPREREKKNREGNAAKTRTKPEKRTPTQPQATARQTTYNGTACPPKNTPKTTYLRYPTLQKTPT
jgi:hypothetical protein